jgi:hypothetical protein
METSLVYLSGPISGCTFGECTDWREYASRAFPAHIQGISPLRAKRFLEEKGIIDKSYEDFVLGTSRGINTRDHFDTLRASAVLVNLLGCLKTDNPRVSIGTVGEMAWAWDHRVPIICAIEPDGLNVHEHPMLNEWIDYRVTSLDEAIETVVAVLSPQEKFMHNNLATLRLLKETKHLDLRTAPIHEVQ